MLSKSLRSKALSAVMAGLVLTGSLAGLAAPQNKPAAKPTAQKPATGTQGRAAGAPPQTTDTRGRWWLDETWKKELGLTVQQVKAIGDIYDSAKDELSYYTDTFERERKELEKMVSEATAPNWVVLRQIDRVEQSRTNFNKSRLMMLYRINQQLTPDQRTKLQALKDREAAKRGPQPPTGRGAW